MNKYFAFISYKREDEEWAIWVHHELENYHLPISLNERPDLPSEFRPIFRDIDELKAGSLTEQIHSALASSNYLIVICSPNAAKSEWINKEIIDFIEIGRQKGVDNILNIFPFIVDGRPHSANPSEECFPDAILKLSGEQERIGGNVNETGRDMAFVKVLSGMLPSVDFAELWNRYELDKAEQERLKREEKERFLSIQSRFVSEKILDITDDSALAQQLSLKILPSNLQNPDRPHTIEAEHALRQSTQYKRILLTRYGATIGTPKISFSSDNSLVAVLDDNFLIKIWDTTIGACIASINTGHPFGRAIAFTPENRGLLAIFGDGVIIRWRIEDRKVVSVMDINRSLPASRASAITSLSLSNSGDKMVISTHEGDLVYFDFRNDITNSFEIDPVFSTAFSPDEKFLVTTSEKGLKVWSLENWSYGSLDVNAGVEITSANAVFSPDGNYVAYFFDNTYGVINMNGNNNLQRSEQQNCVAVAFLNCGAELVTIAEDGMITIWDIETHEQIFQKYCQASNLVSGLFSSDGSQFAFIDNNKQIFIADIRPRDLMDVLLFFDYKLASIEIHPDGKTAVICTTNSETGDRDILIYDFENRQILNTIHGHSDQMLSAVYSPNGDIISTASYDGTIRIWDSKTGECIKTLDIKEAIGTETAFTTVSFNSQGTLIATATYSGDIIIWDYQNDCITQRFNHTSNPVFSVCFAPDGKYVASAGVDNNVKIWNLTAGMLHDELVGHDYFVDAIKYSPNGNYLFSASRDNTLICWNFIEGKIIWRNSSWNGQLTALAISNDGKYLAIASCDFNKQICICDSHTGKIIVSYNGIIKPLNSLVFKPDGRTLICADKDGRIYRWEVPELQTLIDQVKTTLSERVLTQEELKQFYLE